MALGKAFIEVHADTKPFARELGRELNNILAAAEKDVRRSASKVGETISEQAGKGVERKRKRIGQGIDKALTDVAKEGIFTRFAKGIVDSIDDGLSGLPAEIKLALGAAVAALLPFLGAAVTGLVNSVVVAAFGGLGFLVASQFEVVRTSFQQLTSDLRTFFVDIGNVFVEPVLNAFGMIRARVFAMEGWFGEVFAVAATFVEPLTDAFLAFVEGLLPGLLDTMRNSRDIIGELVGGARLLGRAIGEALRIISGSDSAVEGFRDLVIVFSTLILSTAVFIRALSEIYGFLRSISLLLTGPTGWAQFFGGEAADDAADAARNAAAANGEFRTSLGNLIAPTEAEEKALKDLNTQIDALTDLMFAAKNNEIAFEQAMDDLTESVKENGRSLNIQEQAGRDNAQQLLNLAQVALKTRADTIALTGETEKANAKFAEQKAAIYALAAQMKLSKADTDKLIGSLLTLPPPQATGIDQASLTRLRAAVAAATSLASRLGTLARFGLQVGTAAIQAHALGGVFNRPHVGMVAEAGPEAIIPLNNPARAQQVMNQAGLSGMSSPIVSVYIGNQQLDAYIDTRVDRRLTTTARSLAYGGRGS